MSGHQRRASHQHNGSLLSPLAINGSLRGPNFPQSTSLPTLDTSNSSSPSAESLIVPPSASAFRANFEVLASPSNVEFPASGSSHYLDPPLSPGPRVTSSLSFSQSSDGGDSPTSPSAKRKSSLPHKRMSSLSMGHPPPSPSSPASSSFASQHRRVPTLSFNGSLSPQSNGSSSSPFSASGKRHGRIHSRNLSVFFPRPESAAQATIAEDEVVDTSNGLNEPSEGLTRLDEGFRFGGSKADGSSTPAASLTTPTGGGNVAKRRGHHHKHSVSHNLFSFIDPTVSPTNGQAAPDAASPWIPVSPFPPTTPGLSTLGISPPDGDSHSIPKTYATSYPEEPASLRLLLNQREKEVALAFAASEFIVGASLWGAGQARGSLACTGLGYWVVFDSSSVALSRRLIPWLGQDEPSDGDKLSSELRRPFGSQRLETTMSFSQSIYLLFSAVYVLKEAVEHFLLSSDSQDGHHHHRGDEGSEGIAFPTILLWLSFLSLLFSNIYYRNHARLVDATGVSVPESLSVFTSIPFIRRSTRPIVASLQSSFVFYSLFSNPFTLAPAAFCLLLLYAAHIADPTQHVGLDMLISSIETVFTFSIAYPTAVVLGKVLLQTAPERQGTSMGTASNVMGGSGPMEEFSRAIREIERHPQVVHLVPPHFWQLTLPRQARPHTRTHVTAATTKEPTSSTSFDPDLQLVATIEIHVRSGVSDVDILALTKWANDKCSVALGRPKAGSIVVSVKRD